MKQSLSQTPSSPAPTLSRTETFRRFNHGICSVSLLVRLITATQQHRGSTMGYLSGEPAFRPRIAALEGKISRTLELLEALDSETNFGNAGDDLSHIHSDWKTIVLGWRRDQILHNFQFHGHLVNALNRQLKERMRTYLLPTLTKWNGASVPLLETLFIQLPQTIELIATLRGLCTNVAVIQACGSDSHQQIAYLLKEIPQQHDALLQAVDEGIPALQGLKQQRKELQKFLFTIQMSILDKSDISVDSSFLFQLSSDVIDAHWRLLEDGIHTVEALGYDLILGKVVTD